MRRYKISGVPICREGKLVGILTNRDLRFMTNFNVRIEDVMTKENLVTSHVGTTLMQAKQILMQHKIEKLPLIDDDGYLRGLITIKDIEKSVQYPNSARDKGRKAPLRGGNRRNGGCAGARWRVGGGAGGCVGA